MLLNQILGESNPAAGHRQKMQENRGFQGFSGGRERKFGVAEMLVGVVVLAVLRLAVRAARATGLDARTERLINDGLDGTGAAATFGAAAEAAIELLGVARQIPCRLNGAADILVAQNIAGTDDHEAGRVHQ